jgi:CBS domain-containing protein
MLPERVGDLLATRALHSVRGSFTVAAACHKLRAYCIGAVAVLDGSKLVGILSERDILVRVIAGHRDPMLVLVREVMTPDPRTIPAHASVAEALRVMRAGGFRHLPVTRHGVVIGMLSLRDIPYHFQVSGHEPRASLAAPALG